MVYINSRHIMYMYVGTCIPKGVGVVAQENHMLLKTITVLQTTVHTSWQCS